MLVDVCVYEWLCYVVCGVALYVYDYCVRVYVIARERGSLSFVACYILSGGWGACVDAFFVCGGCALWVVPVRCALTLACFGVDTMRLTCYARFSVGLMLLCWWIEWYSDCVEPYLAWLVEQALFGWLGEAIACEWLYDRFLCGVLCVCIVYAYGCMVGSDD